MLKSKISNIKNISRKYPIDINTKTQNTVFLSGVSRSGTTWVSNIINYKNSYRDIFEPFHPGYVPLFRNYNHSTYIPINSNSSVLQDIGVVLSGKLSSRWSDQYNKRFISRKRLIKSVRANLFIGCLNNHFPEIPIILLLRHPCAVANSKLQLSLKSATREWDTTLDKYLNQHELLEDFLSPFIKDIEKTNESYKKNGDIFDNCIFAWCIENYVPLMQLKNRQLKNNSIHVCFYEDFCVNLKKSAKKLFNFLGEEHDERVLSLLSKPSSTSQESSAILNNSKLVENWQDNITQDQKNRTMDIISLFNLDSIYNLESLPNHKGFSNFMGQ